MDDPKGIGPRPKSTAYFIAMVKATTYTEKLSPKIFGRRPLTTAEGTRLLDVNWQMYLYAMIDGDFEWAKETAEFVELVEECLRLQGYIVELTSSGKYCVYRPPRQKGNKRGH